MSIFQSVEFYVIAVVVAAAIIAILGRKPSGGAVRQYLLPGLLTSDGDAVVPMPPSVEFVCADDGTVTLHRRGLRGVREDGAVSLAIDVKGFDVAIKERIVPGREPWQPVDTASFVLDFMGKEHYFISYTTELTPVESGLFASLTLHNRPGNVVRKNLQ
ncbi:MAG: hypothetical protein NC339_08450 [Muribaculaceae bacterium]|nr:hypothetical protein [Muribaculaceae bacterium]